MGRNIYDCKKKIGPAIDQKKRNKKTYNFFLMCFVDILYPLPPPPPKKNSPLPEQKFWIRPYE